MCQAVEEYADQKAKEAAKLAKEEANIKTIKNLMKNMQLSLEEAMDAIGVQGEDREKYAKIL
jgi:hypothetical protein